MSSAERRRNYRMAMAVAVRVQGYPTGGGHWDEMTQTDDVSTGGTSFTLKRSVELGQVLYLTLALPKRLRQHDLGEAVYRVYALVRGISRQTDEYRVGVMFFGKFPPRGFQKTPWARFLLPSDSGTLAVARGAAEPAAPVDTPPGGRSPKTPRLGRRSRRTTRRSGSRFRFPPPPCRSLRSTTSFPLPPPPLRTSGARTRASRCS